MLSIASGILLQKIRTEKYEKLEKFLSYCTGHHAITSAYLNRDSINIFKNV